MAAAYQKLYCWELQIADCRLQIFLREQKTIHMTVQVVCRDDYGFVEILFFDLFREFYALPETGL